MYIAFLVGGACYILCNRCINRFQRIEIIQPQIVLRQFVARQAPERRFARPPPAVHVLVGLIDSLLLFLICGRN